MTSVEEAFSLSWQGAKPVRILVYDESLTKAHDVLVGGQTLASTTTEPSERLTATSVATCSERMMATIHRPEVSKPSKGTFIMDDSVLPLASYH